MSDPTPRQLEHRAYLKTPEWKALRELALERADHQCQVCEETRNLQVHHRTYARWKNEDVGDLTVLCRKHHELFHGIGGKKKRSSTKARKQPYSKRRGAVIDAVSQLRPGDYSTADIAALAGVSVSSCGGVLASLAKSSEFPHFKKPKTRPSKKCKWQRITTGDDGERELLDALDRALAKDNWIDRRIAA